MLLPGEGGCLGALRWQAVSKLPHARLPIPSSPPLLTAIHQPRDQDLAQHVLASTRLHPTRRLQCRRRESADMFQLRFLFPRRRSDPAEVAAQWPCERLFEIHATLEARLALIDFVSTSECSAELKPALQFLSGLLQTALPDSEPGPDVADGGHGSTVETSPSSESTSTNCHSISKGVDSDSKVGSQPRNLCQ